MEQSSTDAQRTPAWYAARKGRVTASMAGALLGLSPHRSFDSAYRALVRSLHDLPDEFDGNIATEYGTGNEATALADFEMETGLAVEAVGFMSVSDWIGASPDGLIPAKDAVLEIKCPFGKRKDAAPVFNSIEAQPHYYAQVQIQMLCANAERAYFWQWAAGGTMLEVVERDNEWITENTATLLRLWNKAKEEDPADFDGPLRKVVDTPEAVKLVAEWDELSEAIENANARKADILKHLRFLTDDKDGLVAGRKLTRVQRKGSVSYAKALAKYAPDADLEPFMGKASESWKLT